MKIRALGWNVFFLALGLSLATWAGAVERLWTGASTDFNDPTNWVGGTAPGIPDIAAFNTAGSLSPVVTSTTEITGILFRPTANAFTIAMGATVDHMYLSTGGIVNQSTRRQRITTGTGTGTLIVFGQVTQAIPGGEIQLLNTGVGSNLAVFGGSLTGNVNIVNQSTGVVVISQIFSTNTIHLGAARMENNGGGEFLLGSAIVGDQATMTNTRGALSFLGGSDYTGMRIVNSSTMSLEGMSVSSAAFGNLSGSGRFLIANKTLVVGAGNTSSEISGVISGIGGSLIKIGNGTLTLSGANTYSSSTTISGGTLQGTTQSLQSRIRNNASLVFNQNFDGSFIGMLEGGGTLTKQGIGRVTIPGLHTFGGTVQVATGELSVTGTLPAAAVIEPGGTLSGTGIMGAVQNSGTLRPGSADTGTLTVASYQGNGVMEVPFDNPSPPKLSVAGNAILSEGILRLSGTEYLPGSYTVLTAGAVNGTFSSISAPVFLDYSADYTATALKITLRSFNLANAAGNANQLALAGALDAVSSPSASPASVSGAAAVGNKLFQLNSAAAVSQALAQLSGDSLTSFYDVALRQGRLFTESITARAVPMDSASTAFLPQPIQLAMNGDAAGLGAAPPPAKPKAFWGRMIGAFATTDADEPTGSPETSANTGGFEAGYDRSLSEDALMGVFLGYSRTGVSVDEREASGTTNSLGLGVHGRYAPGAWFFDGVLGYVRNAHEMDRKINLSGLTAKSEFTSPVLTLAADAGHAFEPVADTIVEPFLALRISQLSQEGFTETGAPGQDLTVEKKSLTSVVPILAVRASHLFKAESRHPFLIGGNFGLETELGETTREITAQFSDGSAPRFTVQGTPQERVALDLGLGGRIAVNDKVQAFMNYGLTVASQHVAQSISGGARLTW